MADQMFNQGKGKVAEWAARINANDPANSVFLIEAILSTATDAVLRDLDTFALIESDANTAEVTNSGYARKTINDASGMTITIDDTNDRTDVDTADQTWTAVLTSPGAWSDLVFGYDSDSTAGTDANVVPATMHDFIVTPDGSDITAQIAVFFRAA